MSLDVSVKARRVVDVYEDNIKKTFNITAVFEMPEK